MQAITTYKNRPLSKILIGMLTSFCYLSTNVDQVLSGGTDTSSSSTEQASATSAPLQNTGSLTVTPTTLLQTGTNNFANVNSNIGVLNYPNCGGTCAFAIMRTTPANNINGIINNQIEGVVGLIHTFNSPDQTNADTNRLMIEIQKYKTEQEVIIALSGQLADAIETGKYQRANIISIILAPKLGKTHYQLLQEAVAKP